MEKIILNQVKKKGNVLAYDFSVTAGLSDYFSGKPFEITYPDNVESVPDAIAAVPFVCCVLPLVWLSDSILEVNELDTVFFHSISEFKNGYKKMYPDCVFTGKINVKKMVSSDRLADKNKSAMFFSGGLDSVQTLMSHFEEKPVLISVWGSDIEYHNHDGWNLVYTAIKESAERFHLPNIVIRSSFREFDDEGMLSRKYYHQLHDDWWHGVKHGIGLLGHVAPYAYLHNISKVYIASSNCPADGPVTCASNPIIDNYVRFADCQVIHDGFEFSRQDKIRNIVGFCDSKNISIPLHVCWQSQEGSNCCHCEKCYRTIAGLIAEGADPNQYELNAGEGVGIEMKQVVLNAILAEKSRKILAKQWVHISHRMQENRKKLKHQPYWKDIKWIAETDFLHPDAIKVSISSHLRRRLSKLRFYQALHRLKNKFRSSV